MNKISRLSSIVRKDGTRYLNLAAPFSSCHSHFHLAGVGDSKVDHFTSRWYSGITTRRSNITYSTLLNPRSSSFGISRFESTAAAPEKSDPTAERYELQEYLSFAKGVIDLDELPLIVSREMFQESCTVRVMRKRLVRKSYDMILGTSENREDCEKFWENFGKNVSGIQKCGNHKRIAKLLKIKTTLILRLFLILDSKLLGGFCDLIDDDVSHKTHNLQD